MKKEDIKILLIFIILILLIIGLLIFDRYTDNKRIEIDRKIEYIFGNIPYDNVYKEGKKLFLNAIKVVNTNNYEYEKDYLGKIKFYSIDKINNYKKIMNFDLINQTFTEKEINRFKTDKRIITKENNYYIEDMKENLKDDYIGSIIIIDSYDKDYVYFKSTNYYCKNIEYIGLLDSIPDCKYQTSDTMFTIVLENNKLKINNYQEILKIIK